MESIIIMFAVVDDADQFFLLFEVSGVIFACVSFCCHWDGMLSSQKRNETPAGATFTGVLSHPFFVDQFIATVVVASRVAVRRCRRSVASFRRK
jgi:hypothetical protein